MERRWRNRRNAGLLQIVGPATIYTSHSGAHPARRHERDYPGWGCAVCGREWPCEPARVQLVDEHVGSDVSLGTFMGLQLEEAVRDMPHAQPAELFDRFLSWTHR